MHATQPSPFLCNRALQGVGSLRRGTKYLHCRCLASGGGFGGTLDRNVLNLEVMSTWVLCPDKAMFGGYFPKVQGTS